MADPHSIKRRIAEIYDKCFVQRTKPHLDKIYSLFKEKPENWDEKEEGGHSQNRYKYFEKDRVKRIVDIVFRCMPFIAGEKKYNILDLGCGFGEFSAVFRGFGHNVISINGGDTWYLNDFNYICTELLDLNYQEINLEDLYTKFYSHNRFDYIFASEILTLDLLYNDLDKILGNLYCLADNIIIFCHKGRLPIYDYNKFSPEIHRAAQDYLDIITYYNNDEYKQLAENLVESGKKFGHHIIAKELKNWKHWAKSVREKPKLIHKQYIKFGPPFLYLDADCEIIKPIDELIQLIKNNDICIRERNLGDQFQAGVMGFGNRNQELMISFLSEWTHLTGKMYGSTQTIDQKPFADLLRSDKYKKLKVCKIPPKFNFLPADSLEYDKNKAVILHHKFSKNYGLARAWRNEFRGQEI